MIVCVEFPVIVKDKKNNKKNSYDMRNISQLIDKPLLLIFYEVFCVHIQQYLFWHLVQFTVQLVIIIYV